jgi:hypothetical protein
VMEDGASEERTSSRSSVVNMSMTVETSASDSGSASCSAYGRKEYNSRGLREADSYPELSRATSSLQLLGPLIGRQLLANWITCAEDSH